MKHSLLLGLLSLVLCNKLSAQYSLVKGRSVLEIGGILTTYYNHRFYEAGDPDQKKNRFRLRDAQLKLEGNFYPRWAFQFDVDFAALAGDPSDDASVTDNPLINDAWVRYKSPFEIDVTLGYQKVPFSRNSMTPIHYQPFIKRPVLTDGSLFHRRDLGLTLHSGPWNEKINLYAGVYNGLGTPTSDNDASGKLELAARADISYPARFRYREVDSRHVPIPMFSVGVNGRTSNKNVDDAVEYIRAVNGRRYFYGLDAAFQWKGFSAQAEISQGRFSPEDSASALLQGEPTDYVRTGGFMVAANYHIKQLNTVIALRYDDLNVNDLIIGDNQKTLSIALVYMVNDFDTALRVEYYHRLDDERTGEPWKRDELRTTLQFKFY